MREDIKERIGLIRAGKVPKGYKQMKFGIIPNDFRVVLLEELVDFQNGINAEKEKFGQGIKIISVSDILKKEPIFYDSIQSEIDISEEKLENYTVNYGDILFQRSSENIEDAGTANVYLDEKRVATFGGFVIRGKKKVDYNPIVINEILKMQYVRKQVMKMAAGAQHINISQDSLKRIWIVIPNAVQQEYAKKFLEMYLKQIDLLQRKIELLRLKKIWLIQNLITGKKRLPGYYDTWKKDKLKKYIEEMTEKNQSVLVSNVKSISNKFGFINQSTQFGKKVASDDLSNYKIVKKGYIAYNPSRINVGSIALYHGETFGVISPMYIVLKTKNGLNEKFFMYYVKTSLFNQHIKSQLSGSVRETLKFNDLCAIKIDLPSYDEQNTIVKVLETADKEIELLEKKLELIKQEKKAIMQLLLTGIVRVNE